MPAALGNKMLHPFSDFLLHDIGTGDGIVQNGGLQTRNTLRTARLWGLRARGRFMHDRGEPELAEAIVRHSVEAAGSWATSMCSAPRTATACCCSCHRGR